MVTPALKRNGTLLMRPFGVVLICGLSFPFLIAGDQPKSEWKKFTSKKGSFTV
jgi:hypothetical protein